MYLYIYRASLSFVPQKSGTIVLARKASKSIRISKTFCRAPFFYLSNLKWPWPMGPKLDLRANFWWEASVWNSSKHSFECFLIF